jgi:DNA replicative helicase MCM subunit Mcm2 (Cdc46/Mcm family)
LKMEAGETIIKIVEFFEQHRDILTKYVTKGRPWVKINFMEIARFDPNLADTLLDEPEECMKAFEVAFKQFDECPEGMKARIFRLPHTQHKNIWEVRGDDVGKFISLKGTINKASGIIHVCKSVTFECFVCGNTIPVIQLTNKLKKPTKCGCGSKKFFEQSKHMIDTIKLGIMDDLMDNENRSRSIAREKLAVMGQDLTSKEIDMQIKPGRKVVLNGYFTYKQKAETTEFESVFEVNSVEFVEVGWDTVKVLDKEAEKIKKLATDKHILTKLSNSIADVDGFEQAKLACILLLAGSPNLYDENNHLTSRGTIHTLLIGDPGTAKTYLAKRAGSISPIFSFQSAATASGKGLIASVSQDKELGTWVAYPGVVPMAHKGVAVIDEIDKTHPDDYGDHNNAMNDMEVPIAKATVKARLDTETSYLATANPENRMFNNYESIIGQIDMPKDFLDRFDIIFPMISPVDNEKRDKIMETMLNRHFNGNGKNKDKVVEKSWKPDFDHEFLRKYIAYCRRANPFPELNEKWMGLIKKKLHELMKPQGDEQTKISFRQLESILRFAYASARLRLRDITEEDINLAFDLKRKSFMDLGIINETGEFSWAKLEDIHVGEISNQQKIKETLRQLMPNVGDEALYQDIIDVCKDKGVDEEETEKYVSKLKHRGDYLEPRSGMLKKI